MLLTHKETGHLDGDTLSLESTEASSRTESEIYSTTHNNIDANFSQIEKALTKEEREQKAQDEELHELARRVTRQSHASIYEKNPFESDEESILNPNSPNFQPRAFTKSMLNLQARDPEKWKQRTAGFSFKDLNVYGFGSATDYQKTVVCFYAVVDFSFVVNTGREILYFRPLAWPGNFLAKESLER